MVVTGTEQRVYGKLIYCYFIPTVSTVSNSFVVKNNKLYTVDTYYNTYNHYIKIFDLKTKEIISRIELFHLNYPITNSNIIYALDDRYILIHPNQGIVYLFDTTTDSIIWSTVEGMSAHGFVWYDQSFFIGYLPRSIGQTRGYLFTPPTISYKWNFSIGGSQMMPLVGNTCVSTALYNIYILNPINGTIIHKINLLEEIKERFDIVPVNAVDYPYTNGVHIGNIVYYMPFKYQYSSAGGDQMGIITAADVLSGKIVNMRSFGLNTRRRLIYPGMILSSDNSKILLPIEHFFFGYPSDNVIHAIDPTSLATIWSYDVPMPYAITGVYLDEIKSEVYIGISNKAFHKFIVIDSNSGIYKQEFDMPSIKSSGTMYEDLNNKSYPLIGTWGTSYNDLLIMPTTRGIYVMKKGCTKAIVVD